MATVEGYNGNAALAHYFVDRIAHKCSTEEQSRTRQTEQEKKEHWRIYPKTGMRHMHRRRARTLTELQQFIFRCLIYLVVGRRHTMTSNRHSVVATDDDDDDDADEDRFRCNDATNWLEFIYLFFRRLVRHTTHTRSRSNTHTHTLNHIHTHSFSGASLARWLAKWF